MSASKQKKVRSELRADGSGRKSAEQLEAEKKSRHFRRNTIIAVTVIVIVLAAALFINSDYLYNRATAVSVGGTNYSAAAFDYFYRNAYSSFINSYGDYVSMFGLDTSTPLDQQQSGFGEDDETWADYFTGAAEDSMQQITALYDEAAASGYTLSQEGSSEVQSNLDSVASYASLYGYDTDAYLALTYGKGMTESVYRDMVTRHILADEYRQSISDSYTYTEQELADYYATVADTYDTLEYYSYHFSTSDEAYADLAEDEMADAAKADAETVAGAKTVEEFVEKVNELTGGEETQESLLTSTTGSGVSGDMGQWLLDADRREGDVTSIADDNGAYALYFVSRGSNDYNTVNVRHILIKAEGSENGQYTDAALAAAKERAEEILAQWEENPTEEGFASLAGLYSEDGGSNTNGGLYENVAKGQMVEEFDAFCFDESRKAGDTGIVYGNNGSYAGYHVMYYVGEGPVYADYIADSALRNEDLSAYLEKIIAGYEVTEKFALRFATVS